MPASPTPSGAAFSRVPAAPDFATLDPAAPGVAPTLSLDAPRLGSARALFDITRIWRRRHALFATGVDRIDIALGLALCEKLGPDCGFVCATPFRPATLPHAVGAAILRAVARRWRGEAAAPPRLTPTIVRGAFAALSPRAIEDATYVVASHAGLAAAPGGLSRIDPAGRMPRLAYVHDTIPLDYPEYQRPRTAAQFERFLGALAQGPFSALVNSVDTARRLEGHATARGWRLQGVTLAPPRLAPDPGAPLASPPPTPLRPAVAALLEGPPFFLCVGTIEPRKNHLLLLNLWRAWAAEARPPRLVIAGRRGWENEMVVDMLERCAAVRAHVREFGDLSDAEVFALMRGARALLMPSFAEGLGVPLLEAAAAGLPAIVSDLPALRETAAPGTVFLDPLDGPAWRGAIAAAAGPAV